MKMKTTYDSYKDSGIPWIGEIPNGWKVSPLKRIINGSLQYGANESGIPYDSVLPRYIRITDILDNKLREDIDKQSLAESQSVGYILKDKDILFARSGATVGKTFLYKESYGRCSFAGYLIRASINKQNDAGYIYYFTQSSAYDEWKNRIFIQSTIQNIGADKYSIMPVILPSLPEQQAIAAYLDVKCADIDNLISLQEEMIKELEAYKQSIITEAVTKGLDPNVPMKDSGIEWIGEIPESWKVCKAKYVVNITHGVDPSTDGDTPVYGSGAGSFKTCGEYKEGDAVLIGRKGATLHIPHYIKGRYWNVDTAFDVKAKNGYNLRYYYYNAICFDYKKFMSQTTLPGMTQSNYNNMHLPFPPLNAQNDIVEYLDGRINQIDALISLRKQKIEELKEYKKSVIFEAVTGKIKVV